MERKVTCQRTITVNETEYQLFLHLRMLANRARQQGEQMALVRITAGEVRLCEVKWNGGDKG